MQAAEEDRIEKLKGFFKAFTESQREIIPIINRCLEGMDAAADKCDPKKVDKFNFHVFYVLFNKQLKFYCSTDNAHSCSSHFISFHYYIFVFLSNMTVYGLMFLCHSVSSNEISTVSFILLLKYYFEGRFSIQISICYVFFLLNSILTLYHFTPSLFAVFLFCFESFAKFKTSRSTHLPSPISTSKNMLPTYSFAFLSFLVYFIWFMLLFYVILFSRIL